MSLRLATISDLAEYGDSKNLSHENLHFKDSFYNSKTDVVQVVSFNSIIDKYYYILYPLLVKVELTDQEIERYRYKPRMYCQDVYGNIELWSTLLRMNNILTPSEFDKKKFKGFSKDFLDKLDEIMIIEGDRLDANRQQIKNKEYGE